MPIIVDPSAPAVEAPVSGTSPDGRLTARVDSRYAGVLLDADFSERLLATNLIPNPSFRATSVTVEVRRNLSLSPRGTAVGSFNPNSAAHTMTLGAAVPAPHPLGITTAARSVVNSTTAGTSIASIYDADGLHASTVVRGAGVWVYSPKAAEVNVYLSTTGTPSSKKTPVAANTWTYCTSATAGIGYVIVTVTLNTGTVAVGDAVFFTGSIAEAGLVPPSFFDGGTAAGDGLTYAWTGTANSSASTATGARLAGWSFNNGVAWRGADGQSARFYMTTTVSTLYPTSAIPSTTPSDWAHAVMATADAGVTVRVEHVDYLGSGSSAGTVAPAYVPATTPTRLTVTSDAERTSAGTTGVRPVIRFLGTPGSTATFTEAISTKTSAPVDPFDGSTPADDPVAYRWTGTADASTSEQYRTAVLDLDGTVVETVRLERDGVPVRSGDPAPAPGGVAVAYDLEAPLGAPSTWCAVAVRSDGSEVSTDAVSLLVPEPNFIRDVWLKCIADPSKSVAVTLVETPALSSAARTDTFGVTGARYLSATWDVRTGKSGSLKVLTHTDEERRALEAVLDEGTLLFQTAPRNGLEDFFLLPGDYSIAYVGDAVDPAREWSIAFLEVGRPATVDSPLIIPGQSYDGLADDFSSYDAVGSAAPSYLDLLGV